MKSEGALAFDTGVYRSERQASGVARASDGEGRTGVALGRWVVAVVVAIVFAVVMAHRCCRCRGCCRGCCVRCCRGPSLSSLLSLLSPPSSPLPLVVIVVDHRHDCVRHATVMSAARSMAEGTSVEPAGGAEKAPHGKAQGMGA